MTNPGSGRLQILIVDDEVEIRELLGEYFSARGHDAHVVSDGQAAQTWLAENPVDILLTDVQMPSLSGVDLIATLKDRTEPLGIVVMTGFPTVESATRAMKLGASDYLLKPFRLRVVYEAVSRAAVRVARQRRIERMAARAVFYEVLMAAPRSGREAYIAAHLPRIVGSQAVGLLDSSGAAILALPDGVAEAAVVPLPGARGRLVLGEGVDADRLVELARVLSAALT